MSGLLFVSVIWALSSEMILHEVGLVLEQSLADTQPPPLPMPVRELISPSLKLMHEMQPLVNDPIFQWALKLGDWLCHSQGSYGCLATRFESAHRDRALKS